MSLLRQFPDFLRARDLVKSCKWSAAITDFSRSSEVMAHANKPRESAIANLYTATCNYYSGDFQTSQKLFTDSYNIVQHPTVFQMKSALNPPTLSSDPWIQLSCNSEPEIGSFPYSVWQFIQSTGTLPLPEAKTLMDQLGSAHALFAVAAKAVYALPKANAECIDVKEPTSLVTKALKAGEGVQKKGGEFSIIGSGYVGKSLLLRGKLFEFNGNALMAEGMYRAASDVLMQVSGRTPTTMAVKRAANRALGELLLKWEKREREGDQLLADNEIVMSEDLMRFVADPLFGDLDSIG